MKPIRGLVSAPYTPFDERGDVKLDTIDELAERARADGLAGVFPCGTTGEFPSLTLEERKSVAERWAKVSGDELPVIVHVGSTCLRDSQALASHAQKVGANAIGAMGPYFFRPQTAGSLVDYIAEIAGAAPDLPFYYYHIPTVSGVDVPMREFLQVASVRIPSLVGIKFTHLDVMDLRICAELDGGRFDILYGSDETLLSGLTAGAIGAVGTTYGFTASLSHKIVAASREGDLDEARKWQLVSAKLIDVYRKYGGHRAMKVAMKLAGVDCGSPRAPVQPLSDAETDAMKAELVRLGFFEHTIPGRGSLS